MARRRQPRPYEAGYRLGERPAKDLLFMAELVWTHRFRDAATAGAKCAEAVDLADAAGLAFFGAPFLPVDLTEAVLDGKQAADRLRLAWVFPDRAESLQVGMLRYEGRYGITSVLDGLSTREPGGRVAVRYSVETYFREKHARIPDREAALASLAATLPPLKPVFGLLPLTGQRLDLRDWQARRERFFRRRMLVEPDPRRMVGPENEARELSYLRALKVLGDGDLERYERLVRAMIPR